MGAPWQLAVGPTAHCGQQFHPPSTAWDNAWVSGKGSVVVRPLLLLSVYMCLFPYTVPLRVVFARPVDRVLEEPRNYGHIILFTNVL